VEDVMGMGDRQIEREDWSEEGDGGEGGGDQEGEWVSFFPRVVPGTLLGCNRILTMIC
jgi:hypothetical protein